MGRMLAAPGDWRGCGRLGLHAAGVRVFDFEQTELMGWMPPPAGIV
jgi:hypothetical protein